MKLKFFKKYHIEMISYMAIINTVVMIRLYIDNYSIDKGIYVNIEKLNVYKLIDKFVIIALWLVILRGMYILLNIKRYKAKSKKDI